MLFYLILIFIFFSASGCKDCGNLENRGDVLVSSDLLINDISGESGGSLTTSTGEDGILIPDSKFPHGIPVPRGLEIVSTGRTWTRLEGRLKVQDILNFYRKYLTLTYGVAVEEKGRGYVFKNARPLPPGNTGALVEVRIIEEKNRGRVAVEIYDVSFRDMEKGKDWTKVPVVDPRQWKPSKPGELPPDEFM